MTSELESKLLEDRLILLYDSLCTKEYYEETIQSWIWRFLLNRDFDCVMSHAVSYWIETHDGGLCLQVYDIYGKLLYNRWFYEEDEFRDGFRCGFRSFVMGAQVSTYGTSIFTSFNKEKEKEKNQKQVFLTMRQGPTPNDSLGTIVIGINYPSIE